MKRMIVLLLAGALGACGGGGDGGTTTPVGTAVNISAAKGVLLGTANGSQLRFPSLSGSDTLGRTWSGSVSVNGSGYSVYDNKNVSLSKTLVTLQLAGQAATSSTSNNYYLSPAGTPYKLVSDNGVVCTATTSASIPDTVKVGDFGNLMTGSCTDGRTISDTWAVESGTNGGTRFVVSSKFYQSGTMIAYGTSAYDLDQSGWPTALSLVVTVSGNTVTLHGNRN